MTKFADLLRQRIGLNSDSVGRQSLQHAVRQRMSALQMEESFHYLSKLQTDPMEWREFIEEILVPESWFFREVSPFECARLFVQQALKQESPRTKLRFLSVPCSRGEEPYSLAITLLDAGLLPNQFEIVACDLSEKSLAIARRGLYRAISFREEDQISKRLTARYFQRRHKEWELSFSVRSTVSFRQANLATNDFLMDHFSFDMIMCRNLMIYLTEDARRIALGHFKRLLSPGGLLYFGHSECRLGTQFGFAAWDKRFPAAFTLSPQSCKGSPFQQSSNTSPLPHEPSRRASKIEYAWNRRPQADSLSEAARVSPTVTLSPQGFMEPNEQPHGELARARDLANQGQLEAAQALCNKLQLTNAYDADLLCLQGLIQQAFGNSEVAETYYHKSLFVEPNHLESLTHLMLLHKLRGEPEQAMNYQRRLELAKSRGS